MIILLYAVGVISIIAGVFMGIASQMNPFFSFVFGLFGGLIGAAIPFGLAKVLENQYAILQRLNQLESKPKIFDIFPKKKCVGCKKEVDSDCVSCPHCASRNFDVK